MFALILIIGVVGYCALVPALLVNSLLGMIHPDLGLFAGCFTFIGVFWELIKKLLKNQGPKNPRFQG